MNTRHNLLTSPQIGITFADPLTESMTVTEWTAFLDVTKQAFAKRGVKPSGQQYRKGGIVNTYSFACLPKDYQDQLEAMRNKQGATSYAHLLEILRVERRWVSPRAWMSYPKTARDRAEGRKAALAVYFDAIDAGRTDAAAEKLAADEWALLMPSKKEKTGKPNREGSRERNIRKWVKIIEQRGGSTFAPTVAYCDGKSCEHGRQRVSYKVRLPEELTTEFAYRTGKMEHLQEVYDSLVLDWKMGREIPGVGVREGNAPFPYKFRHLRPHALSTAARRIGSHGIARAKREALPFVHTNTATLRRFELLLLDDTRVDLIGARDRDGFPVELRAYILMDVACRQILGFIVKEKEALRAEDVWALLASVLAKAGLPIGYPMRIKFERGAVACSAATETLLRSLFGDRIEVSRTSVNGGRAHAGAFYEAASGNWMGKAHIESFMRTFALRLEHIAGQRGGDYRRQPATLGLIGKDRSEGGRLEYTKGSLIHDGVQTEVCDRIIKWIETGKIDDDTDPSKRSLPIEVRHGRHNRLMPVRWIRDAIAEAVAFYNANQNHRMQGFARVEYQDEETGALRTRAESPDERAAALGSINPCERISDADAAALLQYRGRAVTVTPNGVKFDVAPWKGLRYWHEDSAVIHEVSRLATLKRKYVALFDEEALRNWDGDVTSSARPVIHLIGDVTNPDAWRPGKEGKYLETLPMADYAECTDPDALARELARVQTVTRQKKSEIIYASRNVYAEELATEKEHISKVEGTLLSLRAGRTPLPDSQLIGDMRDAEAGVSAGHHASRREKAPIAASELDKFLAAHSAPAEPVDNSEPEIV
jgi:hypothetical protein